MRLQCTYFPLHCLWNWPSFNFELDPSLLWLSKMDTFGSNSLRNFFKICFGSRNKNIFPPQPAPHSMAVMIVWVSNNQGLFKVHLHFCNVLCTALGMEKKTKTNNSHLETPMSWHCAHWFKKVGIALQRNCHHEWLSSGRLNYIKEFSFPSMVGVTFFIFLHWRAMLISFLAKRNIVLPFTD